VKATCPNCQTSYLVADDKVPEVGAKIKCPKCSNTFVVHREEQAPDSAIPAQPSSASIPLPQTQPPGQVKPGPAPKGDPFSDLPTGVEPPPGTQARQSNALDDLAGQSPGAAPVSSPPAAPASPEMAPAETKPVSSDGSSTPNLDALEGAAMVSSSQVRASDETRSSARGVSAIRAQTARKGKSGQSYRVRTARGLTYDFPSRQAMERWLTEREDLTGCEAAEPDGEWVSAQKMLDKDFDPLKIPKSPEPSPDIDPSKPLDPSGLKPMVALPPGTPVGALDEVHEPAFDPYKPPPGPRAGVLIWIGMVVVLAMVLTGGALTLTRYGLVDFSPYLPTQRLGIVFPVQVADPEAGKSLGSAPLVPDQGDPEVLFRKAVSEGRRSLRSKRFSRATLEFKRALTVHPGSIEALEGLAKAFGGLGDKQRALEALKKARSIKHP
jgi:predicted Zn finger-like uncharacterized protein